MKKVIILFFLIIVRVSLYAQEELEYHPFVEEGKVWNMFYKSNEFVDVVPDYEFKYFIEGDTLIAGQNCKKFKGRSISFQAVPQRVTSSMTSQFLLAHQRLFHLFLVLSRT